ncbi:MAG: chloride channel protein [Pseudomonadota bacterium]
MLNDLARIPRFIVDWVRPNIRTFMASRLPTVWSVAILLGLLVAIGAILFRQVIGWLQYPWLGVTGERIVQAAVEAPWWMVLLAPMVGGAIVGQLLTRVMEGRRAEGVADVMEAQALGLNRLTLGKGIWSAIISAVSLGSGASSGREGPMVHLGATIAASIGRRFDLPGAARRTLLGAGVAAAVSASFNAPIAGVVFAHEVILGHYALSAFVPIVIAAVIGSVISRIYFGSYPAFIIPDYQITSYWEVPAFALLGLTCAAVAIIFQMCLMGTDHVARRVTMPLWVRPIIGGFVIGVMGLWLPEILGVGYEATDQALNQQLPLALMLVLIVAKTAATSITLASRFGGGIFSPSLYLGAMTGGAFGIIAAQAFPELASSQGLYAILGMGAVSAAMLGAPFSTTLIVFELTGGYALSLALLLSVSIASGLTQAIHGHSFFQWQLEARGLFLRDGPHKRIVRTIRVRDFVRNLESEAEAESVEIKDDDVTLTPFDTLEAALRAFDRAGVSRLPVVSPQEPKTIIGWALRVQALSVYNQALIDTSVEEHR